MKVPRMPTPTPREQRPKLRSLGLHLRLRRVASQSLSPQRVLPGPSGSLPLGPRPQIRRSLLVQQAPCSSTLTGWMLCVQSETRTRPNPGSAYSPRTSGGPTPTRKPRGCQRGWGVRGKERVPRAASSTCRGQRVAAAARKGQRLFRRRPHCARLALPTAPVAPDTAPLASASRAGPAQSRQLPGG